MTFPKAIALWRPRTPFYYGWLVLGMAALGAFAATGVAQVVLGGVQTFIFEDMGWDRSTIAFGVTAGTWSAGLLTPFVGRLVDRHGPRVLMPVAALIVGGCFFALSRIGAVWHFYAAYIVGRAIANPNLIGVVPRTVAVNFFRRKRNLALGLTSMARPVGGAINIQIISLIAQASSWRVAYRFLGLFSVVLAVPLFLIMRGTPEEVGLLPDGDTKPRSGHVPRAPSAVPQTGGPAVVPEFDWRAREAALTHAFWLVVIAEALIISAAGAIGFQIVPYLMDAGLSQVAAAGALSLSSLLGALGNPGWGYLSDRFSPRRMALVAVGLTALTTSLLLATDSGLVGFFVIVLWGMASGGLSILGSMILAQYFGRASYGSITGLVGPFQTGALGLGPSLGAVLFRVTQGYTALFLYGLIAYPIAALLLCAARAPRLPPRAAVEGLPAWR